MSLTADDLRRLATGALTSAGDAAASAGGRAAAAGDLFQLQVLNPLAAGVAWSDGSQQAATVQVADVHRRAAEIPAVLHGAVPIVKAWAGELASAQAALARMESQAALHGLTITADGRVEPADGVLASALEKLTDPTDHVAETLQAKVRAVLAEATAADESCAHRLLALLPDDGPWRLGG